MAALMLLVTAIIAILDVGFSIAEDDPKACFDTGPQCAYYRDKCDSMPTLPKNCPGTCSPGCALKGCRELLQDCEQNKALCRSATGRAREVMQLQCAVACGTCQQMVEQPRKALAKCADSAYDCGNNAHLCKTMPSYRNRCPATCGECVDGCLDSATNCVARKADCNQATVKGAILRAECPVVCGACKLAPPKTDSSRMVGTFSGIAVPPQWTYYAANDKLPSQAETEDQAKANFLTAMQTLVTAMLEADAIFNMGTMAIAAEDACFSNANALGFDKNRDNNAYKGPVALIVDNLLVGTCQRTADVFCHFMSKFAKTDGKFVLSLGYTATEAQIELLKNAFTAAAFKKGIFVETVKLVLEHEGEDGCRAPI